MAMPPWAASYAMPLLLAGVCMSLLALAWWHARLGLLTTRRAHDHLRAVLEALPQGVLCLDGANRVSQANEQASRLFGKPSQALLGVSLDTLISPVEGDTPWPPEGTGFSAWAHPCEGGPRRVEAAFRQLHAPQDNCARVVLLRDVSRELESQALLTRWEQIFNHAGWGVLVAPAIGAATAAAPLRFELMNPAFARMHGYEVPEMMALPVLQGFAPQARASLPEHIRRAHAQGHYRFESLHLHRDGHVFPVLIDVSVVRDANGQPLYRVVNVQDISEQHQAREALQRSEALLKLVLHSLPVGVWITDPTGQAVSTNPAAQQIWQEQAPPPPCAERPVKAWWSHTGQPVQPDEFALTRALHQGQPCVGELLDIETSQGQRKTILNSAVPLLAADGSVEGAIAVNEDVSALRNAEHQARLAQTFFEGVFRSAAVGMAVWDMDGRIQRVNRALCELLCREEHDLLTCTFRDITAADDAQQDECMLARMRTNELAKYQAERRYLRCDGRPVRVLLVASSIPPQGEAPGYVIVQLLDIEDSLRTKEALQAQVAERERIEQELRESRQRLRALLAYDNGVIEEERKHIAREIHDELGQLLTAMRMDLSLLRMRFGGQLALAAAVDKLCTLADQTLNVVRHVASNLRPSALDFGLVAAIEWLAEDFDHRWEIPCEVQIRGEDSLLSDETKMAVFRIVQESLTNVARHARAGHVSILLSCQADQLALSIRDDGRGFDAKADQPANRGFGLLGMRERALKIGASLSVHSAPHAGTTVSLVLPLKAA